MLWAIRPYSTYQRITRHSTAISPARRCCRGVVLLDEMLQAVRAESGWTIASAKFLHPVRPGETLTLEHEPPLANGAVRFTIRSAGQPVASGTLVPRPEHHGHQAG